MAILCTNAPVPLQAKVFEGRHEKHMFLIVCQLLSFICYCCYCYCWGVRKFWRAYNHCICDLAQSHSDLPSEAMT